MVIGNVPLLGQTGQTCNPPANFPANIGHMRDWVVAMNAQKSMLFLWQGGALFMGRIADNSRHTHHAAQICVGIDGPFDIFLNETWHQTRVAVIPANISHQLTSSDQRVVVALVYGSGPVSRQIRDCGLRLLATSPVNASDLPATAAQARVFLDQIILSTTGQPTPSHRATDPDPRIVASLAYIDSHIEHQLSADELAAHANLSTSRFLHLFTDTAGLPLRRYILWCRIIRTIDTLKSGADLTSAAHVAGFADSAHFSRTFRATFGLTPSEIFKNSRNIQVMT
jgi:AraC-like DNA-binding protein